MKKSKLSTIFTAGIVAGILDISGAIIVYAFVLNLTTPQRVLQSVAAGALGPSSYQGGWNTAMAGLGFHFLIALIFAVFFMLILPFWKRMFSNVWMSGIVYGILVWSIMNLAVLPIATGKAFVLNLKYFFYGIGLIIFLVGVPISLITYKMRSRIT